MSRNGKKEFAELDTSTLPSLAKGWCWTTLATIADIEGGITKDRKRRSTPTMREVPYLRVANVQRGFLDLAEVKTILAGEEEIQSLRLQEGDVLFTEGGDRDKLGRGWVWNGELPECIHQNHIFRARLCRDVTEPKFVSYHGNHFGQKWFVRTGKQTTNLASINKGVLSRFPVPLAPVQEQRRIVAKIEELFSDLDAGVAALERVRVNLKRYRAAVLKAAVEGRLTAEWRKNNRPKETGPQLLKRILTERRRKWEAEQLAAFAKAGKTPRAEWKDKYKEPAGPDCTHLPALPEGWCWAALEQLNCAERPMSYGVLQPGPDVPEGIPLVRVCDIANGKVAIDQLKRISPHISAAYKRTVLSGGEILLTIVGTIGRTAVVSEALRGANTARAVAVIPTSLSVAPQYIELAMRENGMRRRLTQAAHEVARKTLNLEDVRVAAIPIPPLDEQKQIAAEVDRRLSIIEEVEYQTQANLKRSTRLRQAILKRAFEGKLVLQDPSDEPATKLFERIKAERADTNGRAKPRKTR